MTVGRSEQANTLVEDNERKRRRVVGWVPKTTLKENKIHIFIFHEIHKIIVEKLLDRNRQAKLFILPTTTVKILTNHTVKIMTSKK